MAFLLVSACACAQSLDPGSSLDDDVNRGFRRDLSTGPQPLTGKKPVVPEISITLPHAAPPEKGSLAAGVFCKSLVIDGVTVLSPESVRSVLASYEGRMITPEDLVDARSRVTRLYVEHGYVASGVLLPDQDVREGVIHLQAIEGKLVKVELTVEGRTDPAVFKARLTGIENQVLNLATLQEVLAGLDRDPLVQRIEAAVVPGDGAGRAVLQVHVIEGKPWRAGIDLNNHRSDSLGRNRAEVYVHDYDLTGRGDQAVVGYGVTNGLHDWNASYLTPIASSPFFAGLAAVQSNANIIEPPFDRIDIRSDTRQDSIWVGRYFKRDAAGEASVSVSLDNESSLTTLLGIPFSFAPGVDNGHSAVTAVRISGDYLQRSASRVIAARLTLSEGIDAFGATQNSGNLPDSRFTTLRGQGQYAKRLAGDAGDILVRGDFQLASASLLPLEKYSVGGANSVRGYAENQLVRDNGWSTSFEYQHPLPFFRFAPSSLRGVLFADVGRGWNSDGYGPPPEMLYSVGAGVRWDLPPHWRAELLFGAPLQKHDLDGARVDSVRTHFLVNYEY